MAILSSVICGFPLTFVSLRDGVLELSGRSKPSWRTKDKAALGILTFITGLAMAISNLGFVASFGGAVLGSMVIYIYPALTFIGAKQTQASAIEGLRRELRINRFIVVLGVILGLLGASVSVLKSFTDVL